MASTIILSDNGASSGSAGLKQTAGNDGVLILQTTTSGGTATNAIYVDTSQNVGIGTSSPSTKLHVEGTNVISTVKASSGYAAQILNAATSNVSLVAFQANSVDQARIIGDTSTLQFCTGSSNTERARFNSTGAFVLAGGTTTADGIGITFPASQSASSNANTLDDYEEGTWTPTITFGGATTGQTYSVQAGYYVKVGGFVTVTCYVALSNKGSSTGNARISGLPFTVDKYSTTGLYINEISYSGAISPYAEQTQNYIVLLQAPAAGTSNSSLTNSNFSNNSALMINCTYKVP